MVGFPERCNFAQIAVKVGIARLLSMTVFMISERPALFAKPQSNAATHERCLETR